MSTKQYMIYDTDGGGFQSNTQTFEIKKANQQKLIRAAGLTEEVQVYQMVGVCSNCKPEDVLWEPVYQCGNPLVIGPENNSVWVYLPGMYSIGDPNNPPSLSGDVNITGEDHTGVDPSLLGKCDEPPVPVGIETSMAELGCIVDSEGTVIGKVILCKITDEETLAETVMMTAYYEDGTVVEEYTGPWEVCKQDFCVSEEKLGVITDLNLLT